MDESALHPLLQKWLNACCFDPVLAFSKRYLRPEAGGCTCCRKPVGETGTPVTTTVQSHIRARPKTLHMANDHGHANVPPAFIVSGSFIVKLPDLSVSCSIV